jgi:hypothetical protein
VITSADAFPPATRKRLDLLIGKYYPVKKAAKRRG